MASSSGRRIYTVEQWQDALAKLEEMGEPPAAPKTTRDVVRTGAKIIRQALGKGWTVAQIAEFLTAHSDVAIKPNTLAQYLRELSDAQEAAAPAKVTRSRRDGSPSAAKAEGASAAQSGDDVGATAAQTHARIADDRLDDPGMADAQGADDAPDAAAEDSQATDATTDGQQADTPADGLTASEAGLADAPAEGLAAPVSASPVRRPFSARASAKMIRPRVV